MFNPGVPYGYLLPTVFLFMADIANPNLFVGPGWVSTPPAFMRSSASHLVGPHGQLAQKNAKSGGRGFQHNLHSSLYPLYRHEPSRIPHCTLQRLPSHHVEFRHFEVIYFHSQRENDPALDTSYRPISLFC